jgi:hypothetical protein
MAANQIWTTALAISLLCLRPVTTLAEDENLPPSKSTSSTPQSRDNVDKSISFSVVKAEMQNIGAPLDVKVRVQAQTVGTLVGVNLHIPDVLLEDRKGATARSEPESGMIIVGPGPSHLTALGGLDRVQYFHVPALGPKATLRHLWFLSHEYTCTATVDYQTLNASRTISTEFTLTPAAPLLGIIVGGLIGVAVSISFRALYGRWKPPNPAPAAAAFTDRLLRVMVAFGMGAVVVAIIVFIFSFDQDLAKKSPVALQVRDWRGGFVLGLFFEPIANWLSGLLAH